MRAAARLRYHLRGTSKAPPQTAGQQQGYATTCGAAARLRFKLRGISKAPLPPAGQQQGSASHCGAAARLRYHLRGSSKAPPHTAGQQQGSASNCGPFSVPGWPAGFGENIRETFWRAKNGKNAGRPAGFGKKEKEEEEPKVRQNKGVVLGVCSKTRFLTKSRIAKIILGNQLARYTENPSSSANGS